MVAAPRFPLEKLSMKRTVLRSNGTVVPPEVTTAMRRPAASCCATNSWRSEATSRSRGDGMGSGMYSGGREGADGVFEGLGGLGGWGLGMLLPNPNPNPRPLLIGGRVAYLSLRGRA